MKQISSKMTYFHKRIFPAILFGLGAVFFMAALHKGKALPIQVLVVWAIAGVVGLFLMKKQVFDLVDEVYDCGDCLLVKCGSVEETISYSNILNVGYQTFRGGQRVTLTLRIPSKLGKKITFRPADPGFFPPIFRNYPVVDELIDKIEKARK